MGFPVTEAQEESGSGKKQNARIRFIEQFLRQGQQGRLAGLLLGQLDAFNRIATTFGYEQCDAFCSAYSDRLREILPSAGSPCSSIATPCRR
jgi:GGDEF domain-containing protein